MRTRSVLVAVALVAGLTACAAPDETFEKTAAAAPRLNTGPEQNRIVPSKVDTIAALVPDAVRRNGKLTIGVGAAGSGFPPLAFTATDNKTLIGNEPDIAVAVAGLLGLRPQLENTSWENLFIGLDSGKFQLGASNITVTEERKLKYDFASYRQDNLGWETAATSDWEFDGDYENLDGLTVSVSAGTNQEKILLEWQAKLKEEGKSVEIKYFPDTNSTYLALNSGKIDASFGPNPGIAYHVTQTAGTPNATRAAGTFSGAGETLQGLIAATTKKDSGLAQPAADAINYLIENGQYATWLTVWNLTNESVDASEVNPAGLPITNE